MKDFMQFDHNCQFIRDDMLFKPYPIMGGYRAEIKTAKGIISVRFGGAGLLTDEERPYEVWYPTESEPDGYQTAENIFNYIKKARKGAGQ